MSIKVFFLACWKRGVFLAWAGQQVIKFNIHFQYRVRRRNKRCLTSVEGCEVVLTSTVAYRMTRASLMYRSESQPHTSYATSFLTTRHHPPANCSPPPTYQLLSTTHLPTACHHPPTNCFRPPTCLPITPYHPPTNCFPPPTCLQTAPHHPPAYQSLPTTHLPTAPLHPPAYQLLPTTHLPTAPYHPPAYQLLPTTHLPTNHSPPPTYLPTHLPGLHDRFCCRCLKAAFVK